MKRIITSFGTFASIISLGFANALPFPIRIGIIIIGAICFMLLLYNDYKNTKGNEIVCTSDDEIQNAMKGIIRSQGKVCIMSRDLTWVNDEIRATLTAKRDSVLIFAQKENDLTRALCSEGITVRYYGSLGFEPKTRFTVIRYNRSNPQVAIANTQDTVRKKGKFKHTIYETQDAGQQQDKWINSLAIDLISLCQAATVSEEGDSDAKNSPKTIK